MKPNPKKFQFMILGKSTRQSIILNINNVKIRESSSVVLLGLTINNRLTFKNHNNILCLRANFKLHVLRRIRKYLTTGKAKLLCNAFINSQFNYASIIWMFCHKQHYLKIGKIQLFFVTVMNLVKNCFYVAAKCQLIKSSYVYWQLKFLKA